MSKETERMRQIRIIRDGIKTALSRNENVSRKYRSILAKEWGNEESRPEVNKVAKALTKSRTATKTYQAYLRQLKCELKKCNRQHDYRMSALKSKENE